MLRVIDTVAAWKKVLAEIRGRQPAVSSAVGRAKAEGSAEVGFVPTMGALHAGHASLFAAARRENDVVLASVFVNPTQFDEPTDFKLYPRTLEADTALMEKAGVDFVFAPTVDEMYPNGTHFIVIEKELSRSLEGAHRPGHFDGMLTVVLKLLQVAGADRAYFGEKDFQQLMLVRGLCDAFFLETDIVACPTIRETDGLAMSSRNTRLSAAERKLAPRFHAALTTAATPADARARLESDGFTVDYVEDTHGRRLGAVRLGKTRLIDNVAR